ncbi:MAG: DinB family protein [Flavobacteriales bacterium]
MMTYGTTVPAFYQNYVDLLNGRNFYDVLQNTDIWDFLASLPEEKAAYRYAEGKWSVAQVIAHLCDAERVFQYRALHIARAPGIELPGFDENAWAERNTAAGQSLAEVRAEFRTVRNSSLALFSRFSEAELLSKGKANGYEMSAGFIGICAAGHQLHHTRILRERYL